MINRASIYLATAASFLLSYTVFAQPQPDRPREAPPEARERQRVEELQRRVAELEERRAREAQEIERLRERRVQEARPVAPPSPTMARTGPGGAPGQLDAMRNYLDVVNRYTQLANDPVATGVAAVVTAGELARVRGNEAAIDFFNQTLSETKNPTIQRAIRLQLMELHKARGNQELAMEQLRELIRSVPERPESGPALMQRIREQFGRGGPDRANPPQRRVGPPDVRPRGPQPPQPPQPPRMAPPTPPAPPVPPAERRDRPREEERPREQREREVPERQDRQ